MKSACLLLVDIPFPRLSTSPCLSLLGRAGRFSRWLPSPHDEEPSALFPPVTYRSGFGVPLPFCGLPQGGEFLGDPFQGRTTFVPFGAVNLFGIAARGITLSPHVTFSNMATAVLEEFDLFRSLRNTLLYADCLSVQAFFANFLEIFF